MTKYKDIKSNSGLISFGNTGARLSDPRITYYKLLKAINEFRSINKNWEKKDQQDFGHYLREKQIFDISEENIISSDKDVRVKTGFISHLGLTTETREITEAGIALINSVENYEVNKYEISNESFVYLKQFLKYQQVDFDILPLLSLIYSCIEFDNNLPIDYVTYIWAASQSENELRNNIEIYKNTRNYKKTLYKAIKSSKNTITAKSNIEKYYERSDLSNNNELNLLLNSIIPHGKGKSFKIKTISLFNDFLNYWENKTVWDETSKRNYIYNVLKARYKDMSCKKSIDYLEFLFGVKSINNNSDWGTIILHFESTEFMSSKDEKSFLLNFHLFYMFLKKLSVCFEYQDLNIRHLKLLDVFIFEKSIVKLDLIFWYIFKSLKNELLIIKPISDNSEYRLQIEKNNVEIKDINKIFNFDFEKIIIAIAKDYPDIKSTGFKKFNILQKETRLRNLVENIFTKEVIIEILENINIRNDKEVRKIIKELYTEYNATIPALFEFILGISFYWLTNKGIKIGNIILSNLDSNLLPITHTIGGKSDVIVQTVNRDYLIEATLSDKDGQRQMESEPVPRHLAKHIIDIRRDSLALFIAGKPDPNNLVVLRNYKFSHWYHKNEKVESMDILPLSINNFIFLLKENIEFVNLEKKIDRLINSSTKDGYQWYINEINKEFNYEN